jgi:hypothetical protein
MTVSKSSRSVDFWITLVSTALLRAVRRTGAPFGVLTRVIDLRVEEPELLPRLSPHERPCTWCHR